MQYFETRSDNQGQKSLDRLSLFSFIHPLTVLTLIFCQFLSGIVTPNPCIQIQFPLPTPCFNVALNSGVRAGTIWINIENGERGKSLVIMPQWSNTFGPDCSFTVAGCNIGTNETGPLPLCTFSVMGLSMCSSIFSESSPVRSKSGIINELSGFPNSVPTVRCSYTTSSWHGHTGHAYCICFVGKH